MTFTIEPMINEGKWQTKILPDEWTAITKDRKLSAQWEHTMVVTDNGCEVFTTRPEEDLNATSNIIKDRLGGLFLPDNSGILAVLFLIS